MRNKTGAGYWKYLQCMLHVKCFRNVGNVWNMICVCLCVRVFAPKTQRTRRIILITSKHKKLGWQLSEWWWFVRRQRRQGAYLALSKHSKTCSTHSTMFKLRERTQNYILCCCCCCCLQTCVVAAAAAKRIFETIVHTFVICARAILCSILCMGCLNISSIIIYTYINSFTRYTIYL